MEVFLVSGSTFMIKVINYRGIALAPNKRVAVSPLRRRQSRQRKVREEKSLYRLVKCQHAI